MAKELTHVVISILDNSYNIKSDSISLEKSKLLAIEQLRLLNYGANDKSYFWITDLTPTMIMHPYRGDLEGMNLTKFKDVKGNPLFLSAVDTVLNAGEGFLEYYWQWQNDSTKQLPKISYVKLYKEWGWIIGTGVFIDDIDIELNKIRKTEFKRILVIALPMLLLLIIILFYGIKAEKQRIKALQNVKSSEEKFRNLFQNSNDIIIVSSLDYVIIDVNKKALTTYGLKYDEVVGRKTLDMMPEKYREKVMKRVEKAIDHELEPTEIELEPKKNQLISVEIKSSILSYNNQLVLLSTMRDITERKVQEKKLIESRLHYKIVADYTINWEYWLGINGEFKYISPSCKRITGYEPDEFKINPDLFTNIILDQDKEKWKVHHDKAMEYHVENEVIQFRILNKTGKIVWIEHSCQPVFDYDKNYIGVRGSNIDITFRKNAENELLETHKNLAISEAKFKQLSNLTFEGIAIHTNGVVLDVNLAFLKMFGYSEHELLNKNVLAILFDENSQTILEANINSDVTVPYEVVGIKKDGSKFPVEITGKNFYTKKKGKSLRVAAFRDITAKKMHEKLLLNAIIVGEEKERARIAKELHDGLGPYLSTIKFYFQWLGESGDDEKKKIIIEKGNKSMQEAITILREVSNNLNPHILTNYGLMDAISAFIDKFKENQFLKIVFKPLTNKPINHPIEVTLYRIVIELLNNTLKHANANEILISFRMQNEDILELTYSDNGKGFNYYKTEKSNKGIGLLNIENRINNFEGKLYIETEPNKGFKAIITLSI